MHKRKHFNDNNSESSNEFVTETTQLSFAVRDAVQAVMDFGKWNDLPVLILTHVYKHLPVNDRLYASATCQNWRSVLFQPCFWNVLHYVAQSDCRGTRDRNCFVKQNTLRLYRDVFLNFDPVDPLILEDIAQVLGRLAESTVLQSLVLQPKSCYIGMSYKDLQRGHSPDSYVIEYFLEPISCLLSRRTTALRRLDLGGMERLSLSSSELLLASQRPHDVNVLGLASLKQNPAVYELANLYEYVHFASFSMLQMISLDYDMVSNEILAQFRGLKRLVIHVHGLAFDVQGHQVLKEETWQTFCIKNPQAELRLNLVHALEAVEMLHNTILKRSMPLTHLRVMFCSLMNIAAVEYISTHFKNTIRSLIWVDHMEIHENIAYDSFQNPENPFVMMAWLCKKLQELVVHGYRIEADNLVAIARLRGPDLSKLEIKYNGINGLLNQDGIELLIEEITTQLGKPWTPMNNDCHPALMKIKRLSAYNTKNYEDDYVYSVIREDLIQA